MRYQTAYRIVLSLLILSCLATGPLRAQWTTSNSPNTRVTSDNEPQASARITADGSGGYYIAWEDGRNITQTNIYMQHYNAAGVAQWTAGGIPVQTVNGAYMGALISDGDGGVIVAWGDDRNGNYDVYAQRFNASGTKLWTSTGVAICTAAQTQGAVNMVSDGNHGAIIAWDDWRSGETDIYAQHVDANGAVTWTADGVAICDAAEYQFVPQVVADGAGGAIITWQDSRDNYGKIYAQRVNANGVFQWGPAGVVVASTGMYPAPSIASDRSGGAYIGWTDDRTGSMLPYVQHINGSGTPLWAADGIAISNAAVAELTIIEDGSGGVIAGWVSDNTYIVYTQRLNSAGAIQWTSNGVEVCNAGFTRNTLSMAPDGLNGAFMTWTDQRPGTYSYAQRVNALGTPQWTVNGILLSSGTSSSSGQRIASDSNRKEALVVWSDDLYNNLGPDILAQHLYSGGFLPVIPTVGSFTPVSGAIGLTVTISGSGFEPVAAHNDVFFGTIKATVTSATATSLTVTVPTGAPYQPIRVLNKASNRQAQSALGFMVTNTIQKNLVHADMVSPVRFSPDGSINRTLYADIDGDGKNDLVAYGGDARFSVFRNTAASGSINTGSFAARTDFAVTGGISGRIAAADLDGDGRTDVVITDMSGKIFIFRNTSMQGTISFDVAVTFVMNLANSLALSDIDGDGKIDIIAAGMLYSSVDVYRNVASLGAISAASFETPVTINLPGVPGDMTTGDIDGDGKPELLCVSFDNQNSIYVLPNTATSGAINNATFGVPVTLNASSGMGGDCMRVADIDGDGKLDLLTITYDGAGKLNIFRNNSTPGTLTTGSFDALSAFPTLSYIRDMQVGDINGDGKPEIVVASESEARIQLFQNMSTAGVVNAASLSATTLTTFNGVSNPVSLSLADVDGDGLMDISSSMNFGTIQLGVFKNSPLIAPSANATNITFSGTASNATNISWTNGTGQKRIVLFTANTSAPAPTPIDGFDYNASSSFGGGSFLSTGGWNVVYDGTGSSATVTNLGAGTTYQVAVVEYNNNGYSNASVYNANAATGNPVNLSMPAALSGILRVSAQLTNAGVVDFNLVFNAPITGLTAGNFVLSTTGTVSGASIGVLTPTGTPGIYRMSVNTGSGSGTLAVQFTNTTGITQVLTNTLPFTGQSYTLDKDAPALTTTSISSNNALSSAFATTGNTVTLRVAKPVDAVSATALINGVASTPTLSGGIYSSTITVTGAMADGPVPFSMTVSDALGNAATTTAVTTGSPVTIDKTAPSLSSTVIYSSNANASVAKPGDRIIVEFTANEPLSSATVTISGAAATVTQVSATVWSAVYTTTTATTAGTISFSVAYKDRAGNSGVNVTGTSNSSAVVFSKAIPMATVVAIASNYRTGILAAAGDVVTVNFTMSTPISTPNATIAGHVVTPVNISPLVWQASVTMTGSETAGPIAFTISNIADAAGNAGPNITSTTNFSSVTFDNTAPSLFFIGVSSSNSNSLMAKVGDVVKLSFSPTQTVRGLTVSIASHAVAVANTNSSVWTAGFTMTSAEAEGVVPFEISYTDVAANTVRKVSATTNGTYITFDKTAPQLNVITISSNHTNPNRTRPGMAAIVRLTANEPITVPGIVIAGRTVSPTLIGTYRWQGAGNMTSNDVEGIVPFTITVTDLVGNSATFTATTDNQDLIFDKTPPVISNVSISSNNTAVNRAKSGDLVTLSFNSNETIEVPNVTFGGNAGTVTRTGINAWKAVYTMSGRDLNGPVSFAINALDLAGNTTVVTTTNDNSAVTMDRAAPVINNLSFTSGNAFPGKAKTGDTVRLKFTASEIVAVPTAVISTHAVSATNTTGNNWEVNYVMSATDREGVVPFSIRITDLAGNESITATNAATADRIVFDTTAPVLNSIKRRVPLTTNINAGPVAYRVIFSEPVTGITKAKFALNKTGTANATIDTVLVVNDSTYDVRVTNLSGNGNLRLDLLTVASIADSTGNAMRASFNTGEVYTLTTSTNAAPVFDAGALANIALCENTALFDLSSVLKTTDTDTAQSLRWAVTAAPSHGTLVNFPATATSNGGAIVPQNAGYTPAAGFSGTDAFTIEVSDGTASASITIQVKVDALPSTAIVAAQGTTLCGTASLPLTIASGSGFAWTRNGTPVGTNTNSITVNTPGTYAAVVTDANGCVAAASNSVVVTSVQPPKAAFTFSGYCINTPVVTRNQSVASGAISYQWSDGNGNTSSLATPSFTYAQTGSYALKLKVSSSDCPLASDSVTQLINVERPAAAIRMATISTQLQNPTSLQARGFGVSYQWSPANDLSNASVANPVLRPRAEQQLTVRITSAAGCVTVDTLLVKVFENNIYVPKVFTPNGDGQNDILYFNFVNISKLEYVRVFNRQGKRVFETVNMNEGWDGKFNGALQPLESYIWVIKAIDTNGHPVTRQGTVTLLR